MSAVRGTASCYNLVLFAHAATSYIFTGTTGINVYLLDDCRGSATLLTTNPNAYVGSMLNDAIISCMFENFENFENFDNDVMMIMMIMM